MAGIDYIAAARFLLCPGKVDVSDRLLNLLTPIQPCGQVPQDGGFRGRVQCLKTPGLNMDEV